MKVTTVGLDLAKQVFSVHGVDEHGKAVLRKRLSRGKLRSPACESGRSPLLRVRCVDGLGVLRLGDFEITADLPRKEVIDLAMTRDGRYLPAESIDVHGVASALAKEDASVCLEMPDQVTALHSIARTSGSRITFFFPIDLFERLRFA